MPTTTNTDLFSLNHLYWKRRIQQCKDEFKHQAKPPIAQPTQQKTSEQLRPSAQTSDNPSPQPMPASRATPKRRSLAYDVK